MYYTHKLNNDPISSAFCVFDSIVKGKRETVNWFYTKRYEGDIPSEKDPRSFKAGFENWIRDLNGLIPDGSMAIDIGCFTGDTAIQMAFYAGDKGLVLAFDPNPITFKECELNIKANPSLNIDAYNVAIMETEGDYEFLYQNTMENGGPAGAGLWTTETRCYPERAIFPAINLEKLIAEKYLNRAISLIKIDTEGYDNNILWSLESIINKHRPFIITEWLPGLDSKINITLQKFNYLAHSFDQYRRRIDVNPNSRMHDILLVPVEVSNDPILSKKYNLNA